MSRRPSLPGAAELFRSTGGNGSGSGEASAPVPTPEPAPPPRRAAPARPAADRLPASDRLARLGAPVEPLEVEEEREASVTAFPGPSDDFAEAPRGPARIRQTRRQPLRGAADRRPSGREKHDEKITVYCSSEELFELERARLALRGDHGLVVDRGRIVREAVALVLADLDAKGESSIIVRRLRES
jgi:hypothetical protein